MTSPSADSISFFQHKLERLSEDIFQLDQALINNENMLIQAKERLETRVTEIKNQVAFDSSYSNEAQRRAREKELLKAPETINLERIVQTLEVQCRSTQILIESHKRLYNIRLTRFKALCSLEQHTTSTDNNVHDNNTNGNTTNVI